MCSCPGSAADLRAALGEPHAGPLGHPVQQGCVWLAGLPERVAWVAADRASFQATGRASPRIQHTLNFTFCMVVFSFFFFFAKTNLPFYFPL